MFSDYEALQFHQFHRGLSDEREMATDEGCPLLDIIYRANDARLGLQPMLFKIYSLCATNILAEKVGLDI